MSDTYRHKDLAKAKNGIISWKKMKRKIRYCTCEYCQENRKFFDKKNREAAKQDLKIWESGA